MALASRWNKSSRAPAGTFISERTVRICEIASTTQFISVAAASSAPIFSSRSSSGCGKRAPHVVVNRLIWFALKIALLLFVFSWTKGTLPRYRYDQLMRLGWKVFLPISIFYVVLVAAVLVGFGWAP